MAAANLSAMVAVFLTSPLDRFVYRSQTTDRISDAKGVMSGISHTQQRLSASSISSVIMKQFEGVLPSLLLCINPAIYYTVYDRLKYEVLTFRNAYKGQQEKFLASSDAFIVSVIAKLIATFATYPLVRAKLLMMIEMKSRDSTNNEKKEKESVASENNVGGKKVHDRSEIGKLIDTIYGSLQRGGITDLYKGVFQHFIYAAIRSSSSMVVKERFNHLFDSSIENKM